MRRRGIALLIIGFLWIGWDTTMGFVDSQYATWVMHSKSMPPGETFTRSQVSGLMRELSLDLKERHRVMIIPTILMLVGGLMAAFGKRAQNSKF
jgi:hypothetical protein